MFTRKGTCFEISPLRKERTVSKINELKNNLREDEILIHVYFAESYENKQQDEIQSAYFGHMF